MKLWKLTLRFSGEDADQDFESLISTLVDQLDMSYSPARLLQTRKQRTQWISERLNEQGMGVHVEPKVVSPLYMPRALYIFSGP